MTKSDRAWLDSIAFHPDESELRRTRAKLLLLVDEGDCGPAFTTKDVAEALSISPSVVQVTRRRYVTRGLKAAVYVTERFVSGQAVEACRSAVLSHNAFTAQDLLDFLQKHDANVGPRTASLILQKLRESSQERG